LEKTSRREREKQNRRDEILQASWKVFSSKEYSTATIDEIAEAAELSKGAIYLYFNSKADLFLATIEMGIEKAASIIQEVILSTDDPVACFKEIIKRMLDYFEENMGFFEILSSGKSHFEIHADTTDGCKFRKRITEILSQNIKLISEFIKQSMEMGMFRKMDPMDVALAFLEITRGFAFANLMMPVKFKLSDKAEVIASILLDGIREKDTGC
jgi:TetR/AcrR family transcriptional regulator